MEVTCVDISEMPYSLCDMDCDQEFNKSDIEEHCSDCLCVGGLEDLDQQDMPATKAWRPTSVVKGRGQPKTLSSNCYIFDIGKREILGKTIIQRNISKIRQVYK